MKQVKRLADSSCPDDKFRGTFSTYSFKHVKAMCVPYNEGISCVFMLE